VLCSTDVLIFAFVKCLYPIKCHESEALKRDFPNLVALTNLIDSTRDFDQVSFQEQAEWFTTFQQYGQPVNSQRIIVLPIPLTDEIRDYDNDHMAKLVRLNQHSIVKIGIFVGALLLLTWHAVEY